MKVKRLLLYTVVFLSAFTLSLYLTFPVERVVKRVFFEKGLYPLKVSFYHFPPRLVVEELPFHGITLKNLVVKPLSFHRFKLESELCGGRLTATLSWPLSTVSYEVKELKLSECPFRFQEVNLEGIVNGRGYFNFEGKHLAGGKGEFELSKVKLKNLSFGIFSFKELALGSGVINYSVTSKDYLRVAGSLKGKDAEVSVKGSISYNPQNPVNSYLSLHFTVKMRTGKLAGRRFNFSVKGNFNSLRF